MSQRDTESLLSAIAARTPYSSDDVRSVFDNAQISLAAHQRPRTQLQVNRLRFRGAKIGTEAHDGPFDQTFDFPSGLVVLSTEKNLRGKTTVLELITWCLRGSPKALSDAVRNWLETVELDAVIGTESLNVRISLGQVGDSSRIERFVVSIEDTAHEDSTRAVVHESDDERVFERFMEEFMLRRFSMEPVAHWQRHDKNFEDGKAYLDGWPALFGAIYLPNGGDKNLLGDYPWSGLPGRLLQVFLSIPLAVQLTKIRVAKQAVSQIERGTRRRAEEDAVAREESRLAVEERLLNKNAELDRLVLPEKALSVLVEEQQYAAKQLSLVEQRVREARTTYDEARALRIADERAQNDRVETALARRLFQALSPQHCPRCDTPVTPERNQLEHSAHQCAVCSSHLDVDHSSEQPDQSQIDGVDVAEEEPLAASRAAEAAAQRDLDDSAQELAAAENAYVAADQALAEEASSDVAVARRTLELEIANLEGQLEAMPERSVAAALPGLEVTVFAEAERVIQRLVKEGSKAPLAELSREIVDLAHSFGISGIQGAELDLAGHLKVRIDGADSIFGRQPRGGRLRLRVAVVVALLRVGVRQGFGAHPGLIMIDSPGAEEVATEDVAALLKALSSLREELPNLQVIVATAQPSVTQGVSTSVEYQAHGDDPLW
jgi:hypothetical protein